MSAPSASLDPYTALATNEDLTLEQKIMGLQDVVRGAKVGMLTTRATDGSMHSRAMTPASPHGDKQLTLIFLANNVSHKFEEIENDANVNVSFFNSDTTAWASFSGKARISRDQALIHKYWSSYVSAYFGDLKDGTHKGDETDPRISVIEVLPDEIRYWLATKGALGRAIEAGVGAMTGRISAPGQLRTITKAEIQQVQSSATE